LKLDQIALHDVTAVDDYVFHLTNVLLFQARVVGTVQEVDYKKRELWDTDTKILEDVFCQDQHPAFPRGMLFHRTTTVGITHNRCHHGKPWTANA